MTSSVAGSAPRSTTARTTTGRSVASGVLVGLGVAGFVDETVFHQLLHWHHFYDKSTPEAGLVSDGLFHVGSWVAVVAGLFLFADLRRRDAWAAGPWWGGLLVGLGGFQLYDGIVQHKLLQLHQIRYGVDIMPYDVVWNVLAVLLLAAGVAVLMRSRRRA
jgi:uncharacterized membrane protein